MCGWQIQRKRNLRPIVNAARDPQFRASYRCTNSTRSRRRKPGWDGRSLRRSAKRQGLKLLKCGKRRYVTGTEIARFLESLSANEEIH